MKIHRIEPDKAPVIVFCCDEMFDDLFSYERIFTILKDMTLVKFESNSDGNINYCPFCGEKVEYGG